MKRIAWIFALLTALLQLVAPAAAQPAPPASASASVAPTAPPPAVAPTDSELRARVAVLEGEIKHLRDDLGKQREENTKLVARIDLVKERQDGFWTPFGPGLGVIGVVAAGVIALLVGLFGFYFPRIKKAIVEEGRAGLVTRTLDELQKDSRLVQLFESHRDEIARLVLARDACLLLDGDPEEKKRLQDTLRRAGYKRYVEKDEHADVIVLIGKEACETRGKALLSTAFALKQKPVVLYTGAEFMDRGLLAELNKATFAIPANTRGTALAHIGALAAMVQRIPKPAA